MKIARTKIDVYAGTLFMEFGDIVVHFIILDAMKHPSEDYSVFHAEIIDQIVDGYMFDFDPLHDRKHPFYLICILVIPYALTLNLSLNLILYLIFMLKVNLNLSLVLYLLMLIF